MVDTRGEGAIRLRRAPKPSRASGRRGWGCRARTAGVSEERTRPLERVLAFVRVLPDPSGAAVLAARNVARVLRPSEEWTCYELSGCDDAGARVLRARRCGG